MRRIVAWLLVSMMLIVGCGALAAADGMTPGTYSASAQGFHGEIRLDVTVDDGKITGIEIVEQSETEGIGEAALPVLADAVVANQTVGVDSVSGATITSEAFKAAVTDALTQAGADMTKMTAAVEAGELEDVTLETDIVVVGAGAAGLSAGLSAVQNGRNVIVLEKTGVVGGASAMAGAGTMATGSVWQKEDGYEDSPEQLVEDMMENGHNKNDRATVELFANTIGEAFDWLVSEDGAAVPYQRSGEPARTYSGVGRGAGVCKSLSEKYTAEGGTLMLNTPATELIVTDGVVTGVKAEGNGKAYTISAKAVILASGGYGANDELVPDEYKAFVYAGHAGAQGDAIAMVKELDAELISMELINTQPNSMILPSGLGQYCNPGVAKAYAAGGFMVNQDGVRFFNESGNAWDLMQAMKQNTAQYLIMDQDAFDGFNAGMTGSAIYSMEDVEAWLEDDYDGQPVMKTAATLEELAGKLGIPADAVAASAAAFNEAAAKGEPDEFGRTIRVAQSEEGPYYALQMHIRYYASLGGLHINDGMQVLNTKQEAIPGLYAAGEVVGGLEGDVYMGATLFGWAIASGYNAGNIASAAVAE
ncbi:MAG: FAD-dependent oxidoreductase [Clostridia bacterium]|nr:FAD-dependent oxidoreductase [Clostridia bacterium]